MKMKHILHASDGNPEAPLGGKARSLAALSETGLPIPPWFVIAPSGFAASLNASQRRVMEMGDGCDPDEIRTSLIDVHPSSEVAGEVQAALAILCPNGESVAVRSSASDEDGVQNSFAGQLESFLAVAPEDVPSNIAAVWRSGFSERIFAYRREQKLAPIPHVPSVLIQRMVNAEASGVAFGADPVSGRRGIAVVAAVRGLGEALVSGESDADTWHVDRKCNIVYRAIAPKPIVNGSDSGESALSDSQVLAVADLVRRTGKHFGRPQDIEWAIERGELFLLQSRPITSLTTMADPDGVLNLWDNSNIAESYNGITTPLTFSFARRVYEEVYRQFCRILRVPRARLEANDQVFRRMLGLLRGRVYYNLLSWYRVLAMLPGFKANRSFMEQMMGVKEPLPDELLGELGGSTWRERFIDRLQLLGSVGAMIRNNWTIDRQIERFYRRLSEALGEARPDLEALRPDELVAYYRELERKLLTRWDAPLVNDFFAMIFFGLLGVLVRKWLGDAEGMLQNDLILGEEGMISAEPARRVRRMAELARGEPSLIAGLCEGNPSEIHRLVDCAPNFRAEYEAYLEKFGDRCLEELKLESLTLHDAPLTLLRSVGQLARRLAQTSAPSASGAETASRRQAEDRAGQILSSHPLRQVVFNWVLKNARDRVRDRENLRFERTRLFGRVRMIFLELGRRFHSLELIDEPRDIFHLEVDEILGFVEGTASTTALKDLAALRKAEFERFRQMKPPAERFETRGTVHQGNTFEAAPGSRDLSASVPGAPGGDEGNERKGLGCCSGVVRGPVRVITDPRNATLSMGDILVAERTDPGWIMLFPSASGLLVERGSLLSHSAIVAREMGIPAIVSIPGVTRWLADGDWVEMDGGSGLVRRIDGEAKEPVSEQ